MKNTVRFFTNIEKECALSFQEEQIIIPRKGEVVYVHDEPYEVKEITYDYYGGECLIDVTLTDVDESFWDMYEEDHDDEFECDGECESCELSDVDMVDDDEDDEEVYEELIDAVVTKLQDLFDDFDFEVKVIRGDK